MSPFAVAEHFPQGGVVFDLVILMDSNQLSPLEALSAVSCARQAVAVGDPLQLPHHKAALDCAGEALQRFAGRMAQRSLIDELLLRGVPQVNLTWQNKRRPWTLASFVNSEFYGGNLVIFPHRAVENKPALVFRDCSQARLERDSVLEELVESVSRSVLHHAKVSPQETLGVVTSDAELASLIWKRLDELRIKNPSLEGYFSERPEAFFIKGLQHAHGDIRDVVFAVLRFSGEASERSCGDLPLFDRGAGRKYLNVLSTRARSRCEVFSNLSSLEIRDSVKAPGNFSIVRFLELAEKGRAALHRRNSNASTFANLVAESLKRAGFEVDTPGTGSFPLDLAVRDEKDPETFRLGVICDGNVADRQLGPHGDCMRQRLLEEQGWMIRRVWSKSWHQNPDEEMSLLLQTVQSEDSAQGAEEEPAGRPRLGRLIKLPSRPEDSETSLRVVAAPYRMATLDMKTQATKLSELSPFLLARAIAKVVEVESPVHISEVVRRVSQLLGAPEPCPNDRETVANGISWSVRSRRVRSEGDFIWVVGMTKPPIRNRQGLPNESRRIEWVAPEEAALMLELVIESSLGIGRDEAIRETAEKLGFPDLEQNELNYLERVLDDLLANGRVNRDGEFLMCDRQQGPAAQGDAEC
jgi:hypothetical protein